MAKIPNGLGFFKKNWLPKIAAIGICLIASAVLLGVLFNQFGSKASGEIVEFTQSTLTISEGINITGIPLALNQPASNDITINFDVTGGEAIENQDFFLNSNSITIPTGRDYGTIPLRIADNTVSENNKSFEITLSSTQGATLGGDTTVTITILEDDYEYKPLGKNPDTLDNFENTNPPSSLNITNGLRLRLDADSLTEADGSAIASWNDTSGNNNNAAQSDTNKQPTVVANAINGKKLVRFDGTQSLEISDNPTLNNNSQTVIAVANFGTSHDSYEQILGKSSSASWNDGFSVGNNGNNLSTWVNNYSSGGATVSAPILTPKNYVITSTFGGSSINLSVDGELVATNTYSGSQTTNNQPLIIGAINDGYNLNGDIAEILIYDRVLTPSEQSEAEAYLKSKYGLNQGKLVLHLDANNINDINDAQISNWIDSSSSSYNASQSDPNLSPKLKIGSEGINGQNVVNFDGEDDFLNLPTGFENFDEGITSFVISRPDRVRNYGRLFDLGNGQSDNNIILHRNGSSNDAYFQYYDNNSGTATVVTNQEPLKNNSTSLLTAIAGAGDTKIFANGELSATANSGIIPNIERSSNYIAKSNWSGDEFYSGDIAEILIYNKVLSENQRTQVECYLAGKYGLSVNGCSENVNKLWLDASLLNQANNSEVSNWSDISGNQNDATQTVNSQSPTLVTNALNNNNVVRFDGTDDSLKTNDFTRTSTQTIISVLKQNAAGSGVIFDSSTNPRSFAIEQTAPNNISLNSGNSSPSTTANLGQNDYKVVSGVFNKDLSSLSIDGITGNFANIGNNEGDGLTIGSLSNDSEYSNVDVAEVLTFNSALNLPQRTIIEHYLAAKYNLTLNNNKYSFNADAGENIVGIGSEDDHLLISSGSSHGFSIKSTGNTLDSDEYIIAGSDSNSTTVTTSNLSGGITHRWNKTWGISKTTSDGIDTDISFDFSDYGQGGLPSNLSNYQLLYRSDNNTNFSILSASNTRVENDQVIFSLSNADLVDGYYTLGTTNDNLSPLGISNSITDLSALPTGENISLSWSAPANNVSDYQIQYSEDNFVNDVNVLNEGVSNSTSVTVSDLEAAKLYAFRVIAINESGTSSISNIATATTNSASPSIDSLAPSIGHTGGGYEVIINGSNFGTKSYKIPYQIANTESGNSELTNYQVNLTLDTQTLISEGKMRADCGDIRPTDADEFTGLLYFIESGCNTNKTQIWAKIPTIQANSTKNIYITYGDLNKSSAESNPYSVLEFYEGFDGQTIDTSNWTSNSATITQNDKLTFNGGASSWGDSTIYSNYSFTRENGKVLEFDLDFEAGSDWMMGWKDSSTSTNLDSLIYAAHASSSTGNYIYEDGTNRGQISPDWQYAPYKIRISALPTGAIYQRSDNGGITWLDQYTSSYSSENPLKIGFVNYNSQMDVDNLKVYDYTEVRPVITPQAEQLNIAGSLKLDNTELTDAVFESSSLIKYIAPEKNPGNYNLVYTNASGQTASTSFTYEAPVISSLSPDSGPTTGNSEITVSGNYFSNTGYFRELVVNNSEPTINDYQFSFEINTESLISLGKMRADCGDLRIKDTDNSTNLNYYLESGCNSTNTKIWVKLPNLNSGDNSFYLHYGDSGLTSESDGNLVFEFYDGFEGNSIDTNKWDSSGTSNVSSGILELNSQSGLIAKNYTLPENIIIETSANPILTENVYGVAVGAATDTSSGWRDGSGGDMLKIMWYGNEMYAETSFTEDFLGNVESGFNDYKIVYRDDGADNSIFDYDSGRLTTSLNNNNTPDTLRPVLYRGGGTNNLAQWDYYRVRKNIANEPTITIENEISPVSVTFDGIAAEVLNVSSDQVLVQTPAHVAGSVNVVVTNSGGVNSGTSGNNQYTYEPPLVTGISPNSGPTVGGNQVTIQGENFSNDGYQRILTLNSADAETDYIFNFNIDTASLISQGKMRTDCGDIRIKSADGSTNLPYFVSNGCNTNSTTIRTKVPLIPSGQSSIILQYGNLALSSQSNESSVGSNSNSSFYNFESGNLSEFTMSGDAGWEISTQEAFNGIQSAANQDISHSETASMEMEVTIATDTTMEFYAKVSSEESYDFLRFYINNIEELSISGDIDWTLYTYLLNSGTNTLRWEYSKDSSVSNNSDTGYIDDLKIGSTNASNFTIDLGPESALTQVYFGNNQSEAVIVDNPTQITATAPSGSGSVSVKVVSADGSQSNTDVSYNYESPQITQVSPNIGPNSGGTYVEVSGENFGNLGDNYARVVAVNNVSSSDINDYVGNFQLDTAKLITQNRIRTDCGDIRLKSKANSDPLGNSDTSNLLDYWVDGCNTPNTLIWYRIPTLVSGINTFYLSYGDQTLTTTQNINAFPFGNVLSSNNNKLWVAANSIQQTNESLVDTIPNLSDPSNNLSIRSGYYRALLNSQGLNKKPSLTFNTETGYEFTEISDIRSVFLVLNESSKEENSDYSPLLESTSENGHFSRNEEYLWDIEDADSNVINGETYINSQLITPSISAKLEPEKSSIVSLITTDNVSADVLGKYLNVGLEAEIAEVIIFNTDLSQADRQSIEDYLSLKYAVDETDIFSTILSEEQKFAVKIGDHPLFDTKFIDSQTITGYTAAGSGQGNISFINSDSSTGSGSNLFTYGSNNLPNPVRDLKIETEEGQKVKLSWSGSYGNGEDITDYIIKYSQDNFTTENIYNDDISSNNFVEVSGLNIGQAYQFKVIAVNALGNSLDSNIVSLTSLDCNTNLAGADLIPADGAILSGSYCNVNNFNIDSGVTVSLDNQLNNEGRAVKVYAQNTNIQGTINGDYSGFQGGAVNQNGNGPGRSLVNDYQPAGAGHGGQGGSISTYTKGGEGYGSIIEPITVGSGGAGDNSGIGGNGGGAIKIVSANDITIDGSISVNGGDESGGAGAGGSIWIEANNISGVGQISAEGGRDSERNGGGGRIALYYTTNTLDMDSVNAYGGDNNYAGGAGTIYLKPSGQTFGDLIIKNDGTDSDVAKTIINAQNIGSEARLNSLLITDASSHVVIDTDLILEQSNLTVEYENKLTTEATLTANNLTDLTINGQFIQRGDLNTPDLTLYTQSDSGLLNSHAQWNAPALNLMQIDGTTSLSTYTFNTIDNLNIQSNGTLTHKPNSIENANPIYKLDLTTNNITVDSGGTISADKKGYAGGIVGQDGNGPGKSTYLAEYSAGAGYGGVGGEGSADNGNTNIPGGLSYGVLTEPVDLGSGGGGSSDSEGGAGGGAIKLIINNTLTIEGYITAYGENSTDDYNSFEPGSGSGGSIWIQTNALAGNGYIEADGGNGSNGGGGAGGRVALYYTTRTGSQTIEVNGGSGNGDCVESADAAYEATTSGCTGTFYDPNTPEEDLVDATLDTVPNPVSVNSDFDITVNNIKNIFGGLLYSGQCEISLSGPGNYSTPVIKIGTINQGVCQITESYLNPDTVGTMNINISVTNNTTEVKVTTFEIVAQASNKAKAENSPNQTQPVITSITPNPSTQVIGNSTLTLTASGLIDSANDQALNNNTCTFNITGPSNFAQSYTSSNIVGGSCDYTLSESELPYSSSQEAGQYSFTVTVEGRDVNDQDVSLTTSAATFDRFFDIYLEDVNNQGQYDHSGVIPGEHISVPNPISYDGDEVTITSPVIKKYDNTTNIGAGAGCQIRIETTLNSITTVDDYNSNINDQGQCAKTIDVSDFSPGVVRVKTFVEISSGVQDVLFETDFTTIPTTGFPSNLAKYNPNPSNPTAETQPLFDQATASANPNFVENNLTISVSGLKDSQTDEDLRGPTCNFIVTRPDQSSFSLTSDPVGTNSDGYCSVNLTSNETLDLTGVFSFRVELDGVDENDITTTLTTPPANFSIVYDVNLTGADGLNGLLPGAITSDPSEIQVSTAATISSPELLKYNPVYYLDEGLACQNIIRFVNNQNQETTILKNSTTNNNGKCVTPIENTELTESGEAFIKTRVSLLGSDLSTSSADIFETGETLFDVRFPAQSSICLPTFRDDNSNGVWDTAARNNQTNQYGVDEPYLTGVTTTLLDESLVPITDRNFLTAVPTSENPDTNCFKDLYDGLYHVQQDLLPGTSLSVPDVDNPPADTTILRDNDNKVTGIRYTVSLGTNDDQNYLTGYNAGSQICINYSFNDQDGNANFDGQDSKISRETRLYFSSNLNNSIDTLTTSLTDPTCFSNIPPSSYDNASLEYVVEQNVPVAEQGFVAGSELTTTFLTLTDGTSLAITQEEANTKTRSEALTIQNGQDLSGWIFGYKPLPSLKAKAQESPNDTLPIFNNISFASIVNGSEVADKIYKGYKFNTRIDGLQDSAVDQPLDIENNSQACSITYSGPSFDTPQQADGTVLNGICLVDPVPDNVGTGNLATMTIAGDNSNLAVTGNFDVISGVVDICTNTFADYNNDVLKQDNEAYLPNREIKLFDDQSNTQLGSTILSSTQGQDCFTDIEPGVSYRLEQTPFADNIASTNGGSTIYVFTPEPEQDLEFDFGYNGNSSICPYAFRDDSGDGIRNNNAYGDSEVFLDNTFTAFLVDDQNNSIGSIQVDNSDCFDNLLPGNYELSQSIPLALKVDRTNYTNGTLEINNLTTNVTEDIEFGYKSTSDICLPTYRDYDKSGTRNNSESQLDGLVTKLIRASTNQQIGQDLIVNGTNCFNDIIPDDYRLEQTKLANSSLTNSSDLNITYTQDSSTSTAEFNFNLGSDLSIPFGYIGEASICPYPTFQDLNKNGIKENSENDIDGVSTTLKDSFDVVVGTLSTDVSSNLCFTDLLPGDYRVTQIAPLNTSSTTGGQDRTINGLQTSQDLDISFGYNGDPTICPAIYRDDNSNTIFDGSENRLAGVIVRLKDSTGTNTLESLTSTTANNNCFDDLSPGDYIVEVETLANYTLTTANTQSVTINFGDLATPEFGFNGNGQVCADPTFRDTNQNSTFDTNEAKFANVNTYLKYLDNNLVVPVQVTNSEGITCFTDIVPGEYTVSQDAPEGSTSTTGGTISIILVAGEDKSVQFGYQGSGSICANPTFNDQNFNSIKNTTEPLISGAETRLYLQTDTNNQIASLTTDGTGTQCFTGLLPDDYRLVQDIPTGFDPNSSTTGGQSKDFSLTAGEYKTLAFGYTDNPDFALGSISGFLYIDRNENGEYNPNGTDLAQITVYDNDIPVTRADVQLLKQNDNTSEYELLDNQLSISDPQNPETDGTFAFTGLLPGNYKVTIVTPQGTQPVIPNPSEIEVTITGNEKITDLLYGFQYTARICPALFVDKDNNGIADGTDIDLLSTNGAYYQLSYESFNGSQIASDGNSFGFLINTQNPCIEKVPPRDYTVVFRSDLSGNLSYHQTFDETLYDQITPNETATIFLGNQEDILNRYYTLFEPDFTPSTIQGKIWNNRFNYQDYDPDGHDDQTGIDSGFNRDYDNDFGYANINLTLRKCREGFGEVQADIDNWNLNPPTTTTDSEGEYSFANIPPGAYAVVRDNNLLFESALEGLPTNDCDIFTNYTFFNNFHNVSGGHNPGSTIDYNIITDYKANIQNSLYIDQNHNGIFDSWESNGNITNVMTGNLTLKDSNGNISAVQPSDGFHLIAPFGSEFESVPPDNYTIELIPDSSNAYPLNTADQVAKSTTITTGTDDQEFTFGFDPTDNSSISGRVFIDRNDDNDYQVDGADGNSATVFDNDIAQAGSVVELYYGATLNPSPERFVASTTTAADGSYNFTGIPEGYYSARITTATPEGTACLRCDWGINQPFRYDVIYVQKDANSIQNLRYNYDASLTISSFFDTVANSIRDETEVPAEDMLFTITYSDGYVIDTVVPNEYNLSNPQLVRLPPGSYQVSVTNIPSGTNLGGGITNPHTIDILPNESYVRDYPFTPFTNNTFQGYVFIDRNRDNVLQIDGEDQNIGNTFDNESVFEGATVNIIGPLGVYSTTTDVNGYYEIPNLPSGNYLLHEDGDESQALVDLNNPLANQVEFHCYTAITCRLYGSDADGQNDWSLRPSQIESIRRGIDLKNATVSNSYYTYSYTSTLNARCIDDLNGDGTITSYPETGYTEEEIEGCSFRITTPTGEFLTFDVGKNISATSLPPGDYSITLLSNAPNRINTNTTRRDTSPFINLGSLDEVNATFTTGGGRRQTAYFNFMQFTTPITNNASITGKTYVDRAEDNIYQPEGIDGSAQTIEDNDVLIPNIPISLDGNTQAGNVNRNTTTNNEGKYQFTDLPGGTYDIEVDFEQ
ncbi:MAG: DUF2341 domain-containing protein [Patescibacteria group bacterium]